MTEMSRQTARVGDGIAEGNGTVSQAVAASVEIPGTERTMTMEDVLRRENLLTAYQHVKSNAGSPGVDGMTVDELGPYLVHHGRRSGTPCVQEPTARKRSAWWRLRSRAAEASVAWGSRRSWTA